MRTILYPPTIDYSFMKQRPQHLMEKFAELGWGVYYCNKNQDINKPLTQTIKPNFKLVNNFSLLCEVLFEIGIFFTSWAKYVEIVDAIPSAKLVIYDCLDNFIEWEKYEKEMLKRADIVTTTSKMLYDKVSQEHKKVYLVPNGCDPAFIQKADSFYLKKFRDKLITEGRKRPIVGFVGALGNWVDVNLIEEVAKKYTTIVVGPEFGNSCPRNVINLGMQDYRNLPLYYNLIDVGIIPFKINNVSLAANPIKMYEYFAAGKPVVAIKTPETEFGDVYSVGRKDFIDAIGKAYSEDSAEKQALRKQLAKENSWEKRAREIKAIIEDELQRRGL